MVVVWWACTDIRRSKFKIFDSSTNCDDMLKEVGVWVFGEWEKVKIPIEKINKGVL